MSVTLSPVRKLSYFSTISTVMLLLLRKDASSFRKGVILVWWARMVRWNAVCLIDESCERRLCVWRSTFIPCSGRPYRKYIIGLSKEMMKDG